MAKIKSELPIELQEEIVLEDNLENPVKLTP